MFLDLFPQIALARGAQDIDKPADSTLDDPYSHRAGYHLIADRMSGLAISLDIPDSH
jgi:hypothetical protein